MIPFPVRPRRLILIAVCAGCWLSQANGTALATPLQENIARYAAEAKASDNSFDTFSAERGRSFFSARPAAGKPDTPSCTTCHTADPKAVGQTRAGKEIAPMALSRSPDRYADMKKLEKWFRRNCKSVLGRLCSALEKGDFLTFMAGQ